MAKRKRAKKRKPIKRRTTTMATKPRRKRRRKSSTTSMRRRLSAAPRRKRRRRSRGLSDGINKTNFMKAASSNFGGAVGGTAFLFSRMIPMPTWLRIIGGYSLSMGLAMYGAPNIGAGMAGAVTYRLGEQLLAKTPVVLNDDLEDTNYVDTDTLSDTGMQDRNGNPVVIDDNGNAYALNENNELEEMDDDDMQSVSGVPLMDAYSLQENPYALAANY